MKDGHSEHDNKLHDKKAVPSEDEADASRHSKNSKGHDCVLKMNNSVCVDGRKQSSYRLKLLYFQRWANDKLKQIRSDW